jgi:hypothetical protein
MAVTVTPMAVTGDSDSSDGSTVGSDDRNSGDTDGRSSGSDNSGNSDETKSTRAVRG